MFVCLFVCFLGGCFLSFPCLLIYSTSISRALLYFLIRNVLFVFVCLFVFLFVCFHFILSFYLYSQLLHVFHSTKPPAKFFEILSATWIVIDDFVCILIYTIYKYIYIYIYIHACTRISLSLYIYIYIYIYVCVCMCLCVCVCVWLNYHCFFFLWGTTIKCEFQCHFCKDHSHLLLK